MRQKGTWLQGKMRGVRLIGPFLLPPACILNFIGMYLKTDKHAIPVL